MLFRMQKMQGKMREIVMEVENGDLSGDDGTVGDTNGDTIFNHISEGNDERQDGASIEMETLNHNIVIIKRDDGDIESAEEDVARQDANLP